MSENTEGQRKPGWHIGGGWRVDRPRGPGRIAVFIVGAALLAYSIWGMP